MAEKQVSGEEGDSNGSSPKGPRATLERLADIQITGKFAINIRILLEPIGFLRIILIVLCLLAFSLTAGFGSSGSSNMAACDDIQNVTITITVGFSYPYRASSFSFQYNPPLNSSAPLICTAVNTVNVFSGSAEYYVFMSTLSFIYGILAVACYVLFYVPRYDIAKYLSVVDFIATCILVFFFFLADIAWSAGSNQLSSFVGNILSDRRDGGDCVSCMYSINAVAVQSFAQLSVSLLFGWVATLVLIASIWFVYKDTIIHLDRMGPLYKMSFYRKRAGTSQERQTAEDKYSEEPTHTPEPDMSMRQVELQAGGWDDNESSPTDDANKW